MARTVVLIAAPVLHATLREQFRDDEVISFGEHDLLRALETISTRRPAVIALERAFVGSPRGKALVHRMQADPALAGLEIQSVSLGGRHDGMAAALPPEPEPAAIERTPRTLDTWGTRRVPRLRVEEDTGMLIDGHSVRMVDLSTYGAQITSPAVLKPGQRVRVGLVDDLGSVRCVAVVVWAAYELRRPTQTKAHYRAGLAFVDGDPDAINAFALRHVCRD